MDEPAVELIEQCTKCTGREERSFFPIEDERGSKDDQMQDLLPKYAMKTLYNHRHSLH